MKKYLNLVYIFAFIVFCFIFSFFYLRQETPLYQCDYVEYNLWYYDLGGYLLNLDFKSFFNELFWQIVHINRNPFCVVLLLPFYFIFKVSRLGFVFGTEVIFMLPVMLLMMKIINDNLVKSSGLLKYTILSAVFLCPNLWLCPLKGIPDICGMIPVLCAWILYLKTGLAKKPDWKYLSALAVLLYLSFLFRRWYSAAIFAFLCSAFIDSFITVFLNKDNIKQILKKTCFIVLNLAVISIITYLLAYLIQHEYMKNIVAAESAERAIYSFGMTLFSQLKTVFTEKIGCIYTLLMLTGCICFIKNKFVRFASLNLIMYLSAFFIIMNSQFLWINHYLFPVSCIIMLAAAGIYKINSIIRIEKIKNVFLNFMILLNLVNFIVYFYPVLPSYHILDFIFPVERGYAFKDDNYEKVTELYNNLEYEYNLNNNITVAIYGLDTSVGHYQFRNISGNSSFAKNNILDDLVLDTDYHFQQLLADYVILIDPADLYIADKSLCRVLYTIYDLFMNNEGIAQNYSLINKYKVNEQGKQVFVYKSEKPLTAAQMREFASSFYEFYPAWEEDFERFLSENNLTK